MPESGWIKPFATRSTFGTDSGPDATADASDVAAGPGRRGPLVASSSLLDKYRAVATTSPIGCQLGAQGEGGAQDVEVGVEDAGSDVVGAGRVADVAVEDLLLPAARDQQTGSGVLVVDDAFRTGDEHGAAHRVIRQLSVQARVELAVGTGGDDRLPDLEVARTGRRSAVGGRAR